MLTPANVLYTDSLLMRWERRCVRRYADRRAGGGVVGDGGEGAEGEAVRFMRAAGPVQREEGAVTRNEGKKAGQRWIVEKSDPKRNSPGKPAPLHASGYVHPSILVYHPRSSAPLNHPSPTLGAAVANP